MLALQSHATLRIYRALLGKHCIIKLMSIAINVQKNLLMSKRKEKGHMIFMYAKKHNTLKL